MAVVRCRVLGFAHRILGFSRKGKKGSDDLLMSGPRRKFLKNFHPPFNQVSPYFDPTGPENFKDLKRVEEVS